MASACGRSRRYAPQADALPHPAAARTVPAMFTGIVENLAAITAVMATPTGSRLTIDLGPLAADAKLGDSICVSGACLTIVTLEGSRASFDVSAETLRKTTIGTWRAGSPVNLERALKLGDRLGGHLVSGHVDVVGRLLERHREGEAERFTFLHQARMIFEGTEAEMRGSDIPEVREFLKPTEESLFV